MELTFIHRADLIFLLDSSNDVSTKLFKQQKGFIKSIVGKFQIAANKSRAAVVRYSSTASSVIRFNTFNNLLDLVRGIENIQYLGGSRRMDAALKEAYKMRETARSDVPTYVIFLTAGRQASTPFPTPLDRAAPGLQCTYVCGGHWLKTKRARTTLNGGARQRCVRSPSG